MFVELLEPKADPDAAVPGDCTASGGYAVF